MTVDKIICRQCKGDMKPRRVAKHSQFIALLFIVVGIALCLSVAGLILGIPIFLVGMWLGCGTNNYWVCQTCGTKIERF